MPDDAVVVVVAVVTVDGDVVNDALLVEALSSAEKSRRNVHMYSL